MTAVWISNLYKVFPYSLVSVYIFNFGSVTSAESKPLFFVLVDEFPSVFVGKCVCY